MNTLVLQHFLESEWIEGCRRGDARCQEKVFRHFYGFVMGICLRYSNSDQQAQEILNDSFLKVFENILVTPEILVFRAWLRRIVVNTALDHYRKERRRLEKVTTDIAGEDMMIGEDIIDKLSAEEIIKLLQELPESQRLVFNLYEIEGYSHQEIGDMLGFPAATSRTYLTRGKQRIKSLMLQRKFGSRYGE